MATTNTATRDKANGQYTDSNFAKVCQCGHSLGVHSADKIGGVRPCFNGDTGEPCECQCFKVKRTK